LWFKVSAVWKIPTVRKLHSIPEVALVLFELGVNDTGLLIKYLVAVIPPFSKYGCANKVIALRLEPRTYCRKYINLSSESF